MRHSTEVFQYLTYMPRIGVTLLPSTHKLRYGAITVVVAFVTLGVLLHSRMQSAIDWNPSLTTDELVGYWEDGNATLEILADGRYTCSVAPSCTYLGKSGKWIRRDDFTLQFTLSPQSKTSLRLVRREKNLFLVAGTDSVDPDEWDPNFKFVRRLP